MLVALLIGACGVEGCPEPRGYAVAGLRDFVDVTGQVCQTSRADECRPGFVDADSRMTLMDAARRLRVDGPGAVEDACESRAVVAGLDGSRADGHAVYEGDAEWSWTMRVDYTSGATCCYAGRLVGNPSALR